MQRHPQHWSRHGSSLIGPRNPVSKSQHLRFNEMTAAPQHPLAHSPNPLKGQPERRKPRPTPAASAERRSSAETHAFPSHPEQRAVANPSFPRPRANGRPIAGLRYPAPLRSFRPQEGFSSPILVRVLSAWPSPHCGCSSVPSCSCRKLSRVRESQRAFLSLIFSETLAQYALL